MNQNHHFTTDVELERLSALQRYDILDTPPDTVFDRITSLAARMFQTAYAFVSLVDRDRVWFKSSHGTDTRNASRGPGLCADAIGSDELYIVEDASNDPRACDNPLVTGSMGLRFYAGAPLITHDGYRIGTFCVIDSKPRSITHDEKCYLKDLAAIVIDTMELRLSARRVVETISNMQIDPEKISQIENVLTICAWSKKVRYQGEWMRFEDFMILRMGFRLTHGVTEEVAMRLIREAGLGPADIGD